MKYFKPELLARCRSLDDDTAEAAAEEWEQALAAYRSRLRGVRRLLPAGARRLLSRSSLHDAKVLTIAEGSKQPWFSIRTRLEGAPSRPGDVLELTYLLVAGPHGGVSFRKYASLKTGPSDLGWILYDELDLDAERAFFTHSLLLTGGFEIEVRFHNLQVRRLEKVHLPPLELAEEERIWPLVGA